MTRVQFVGDENWETIGSITGVERYNADNTVIPISPLIFPQIIYHSTILIACNHQPNQPSAWTYAGRVSLLIRTGLVVGGALDSSIGSKKLFFQRNNICTFPNLANNYGLIFYVPKWFSQIVYTVFGYVGEGNPDIESKLDTSYANVMQKLNDIDGKLTTLIHDFDAYTGLNNP